MKNEKGLNVRVSDDTIKITSVGAISVEEMKGIMVHLSAFVEAMTEAIRDAEGVEE